MKKIIFIFFAVIIFNQLWSAPIKVFPNRPPLPRTPPHITTNQRFIQNFQTPSRISKDKAFRSTTPNAQLLKKMNPSQTFNKNFMCHGSRNKKICTRINYYPNAR